VLETADPAKPLATTEDSGDRRSRGSGLWWLASVAAVVVLCVLRMIREPRFFFWDDTQLGAFGQWYGLGSRILSGEVTLLSPGSWQGGNYLAEGQWGILSPMSWLIGLGSHVIPNATVYATIIKIVLLIMFATGAFLLARAYSAAPWWAAVAGFTAVAGGQTIFMDAPSWVTGVQNVALFALAWWALKRHLDTGKRAWLFFVFSYLLLTAGYVFGAIELAGLLIAMLVDRAVRRDKSGLIRVVVLGAFSALIVVLIFLPGLLTSPVTTRSGADILNDQFLNMDLGDLATSPIATATSSVKGYWGDLVPVPLQYVTWLAPLLVVCTRWRASLKILVIPVVLLAFNIAIVIGPSVIGPLRYPARMMPYVVLCVAVIFAVVATKGWPERLSRSSAALAVGVTAITGWLAWAAQPGSWRWVALSVALQCGAILVLMLRGRLGRVVATAERTAAVLLVASLVVLVPQIVRYPSSPLGNFNVPSSVAQLTQVGADLDPGIMTIGDVYSLQRAPASYKESLLANLWYLTGKDAASVYTVLPYATFAKRLCIDLRGQTCPKALTELFASSGGRTLADDMALNSVIVIKGPGLDREPAVPEGWSLKDREYTWLLTRDAPVERAGGIVHVEGDADVRVISRDDTSVTLSVDRVGAQGASIVFSRLAWPGYRTSGGVLGAPERGFLLTLDLAHVDAGSTITVSFAPPGWGIELAAGALALLIAVGWVIYSWRVSVSRRSRIGSGV